MNAPSLSEIRASAARELTDEKMDQVRELLMGDALRQVETRIAYLEARINSLETVVSRKLEAIEERFTDVAGASDIDRRAAFEALAGSVADLGEQIRRIAKS